ncbi:MAG: FtsX-like permease family protein [Planctomycetes bacterium]|nr:FtsX-like permease family protein [Planctomycetota bacterium]
MSSIATKNLKHSKVRTLVAIGGVCFAVTLLFMQLGFFATVSRSATLIYDGLDFDVVLTSPNYVVLTQASTFPRSRLHQVHAHPQVEHVMPLYVSRHVWRNPQTRFHWPTVVLGVNPRDPVSHRAELAQQLLALARPDTLLIDTLSKEVLGPQESGTEVEVGSHNLHIIGQFTTGPGFEAGLIVVGDQTFSRIFGGRPLSAVNVGLVKLRPSADPEQVVADLRRNLPADVRVLTRRELADKEIHYWLISTSTGVIFISGVTIALLFGVVITYQVLSLEVNQRLPEYATLKAMGFSDVYLNGIVLKQAIIFAIVSYIPGFFIAVVIYATGAAMTGLPMGMTVSRALAVFVLNLLLCCVSGVLALRILRRADPVELFH